MYVQVIHPVRPLDVVRRPHTVTVMASIDHNPSGFVPLDAYSSPDAIPTVDNVSREQSSPDAAPNARPLAWYWVDPDANEARGPVTTSYIGKLVASGQLQADAYVWHTNAADWLPVENVVELSSFLDFFLSSDAPPADIDTSEVPHVDYATLEDIAAHTDDRSSTIVAAPKTAHRRIISLVALLFVVVAVAGVLVLTDMGPLSTSTSAGTLALPTPSDDDTAKATIGTMLPLILAEAEPVPDGAPDQSFVLITALRRSASDLLVSITPSTRSFEASLFRVGPDDVVLAAQGDTVCWVAVVDTASEEVRYAKTTSECMAKSLAGSLASITGSSFDSAPSF